MQTYIISNDEHNEQGIVTAENMDSAIKMILVFRPHWELEDLTVHEIPLGSVCFRKI